MTKQASQPEIMVSIPLSLLRSLCHDADELTALDAAGVDNWHGYEYVQDSDGEDLLASYAEKYGFTEVLTEKNS